MPPIKDGALATKTKTRAAIEAKPQEFKERNGGNSEIICNTSKVIWEIYSLTDVL